MREIRVSFQDGSAWVFKQDAAGWEMISHSTDGSTQTERVTLEWVNSYIETAVHTNGTIIGTSKIGG